MKRILLVYWQSKLAKGIGSWNTDSSLPILYSNLGKTFEYAPVLYCEIPKFSNDAESNQALLTFLNTYVQEMNRTSGDSERAYGFAAYGMLIKTTQEKTLNEFGLRYCVGIYYERKDAILLYLLEKQKETPNDLLLQLIESFRVCRIRNTLKDEELVNSSMTSEEILKATLM